MSSTAVAYPNIALIKYWGKQDERLILPATASLSLTLDVFPTTTTVQLTDDRTDMVVLNGSEVHGAFADRVVGFLDLLRCRAGSSRRARITTRNDGPTAAGLASSSSGFAALALAGSTEFGMDLSAAELSRLARRGSGSACRSIHPGLSSWLPGSDATSYAQRVSSNGLDLAMVIVMISAAAKSVSSRAAMQSTAHTSPYYQAWVEASRTDMAFALDAVGAADLPSLGRVVERNALRMHATMLAADPPVIYFEPLTLDIVRFAHSLRSAGCQVFATMDAGPNVKLLCSGTEAGAVAQAVSATFDVETVIARPGPGAHQAEGAVGS